MNETIKGIWDKICAGAAVAGELATKTAETAGEKAKDVYAASKNNLKILNLNAEIDVLYKEVGKLIYAAHCSEETSSEELDARLLAIDEKKTQIEELRAEVDDGEKVCSECGKVNPKESAFCAACGTKLDD